MGESCKKLMNLPTANGGYVSGYLDTRRIHLRAMSRWHMQRKPYTYGDAPLREE